MYAIIQAGGRQVKVVPGATVELDGKAAEAGKKVTFDQVLFLARDGGEMTAGAPFVSGAKVLGVVDGEVARPEGARLQEEAPQGFPQAGRTPRVLHARADYRHRRLTTFSFRLFSFLLSSITHGS